MLGFDIYLQSAAVCSARQVCKLVKVETSSIATLSSVSCENAVFYMYSQAVSCHVNGATSNSCVVLKIAL